VSVFKIGGLARFISLPVRLCILALCSGCLVTQTVANESAPTMRSLPVEVPQSSQLSTLLSRLSQLSITHVRCDNTYVTN